MANYKITIENIRPQDKIALSKATGLSDNVKFSVVADKIIAYDENGNETDFVLSGESVIDTTITDVADYEETYQCHGFIYANGYLWASMRTAGSGQSSELDVIPQILKINPYDLSDYEILYYASYYVGGKFSSVDQLIYAKGYIWFPHSYSEQKLIRLDPNISLSNPSCYEEIDFSSIGISTISASIINNNNDSIFLGTLGGIGSSGSLTCSNVVLGANNRDISFTIENHIIDFDLKTMVIGGFYINGDTLYASQALSISSITISGTDTLITGTILWINDTDVFVVSSIYASYSGSVVIKFDISDVGNVFVDNIFYIGTSTNLHAGMQYDDNVVFTSQSSGCAGQLAVKIDENDNCSFGVIPSASIYSIDIGGGTIIWVGTNYTITDDICCIGDYGYFGNESQPNNTSTIYKFNLITMKNDSSVVVNEVNACYGTFSYNNQVYALFDRSPGKIVIFDTNLNITQEIILPDGYDSCNEFVVTDDSIYIAFWETRPLRIIRIPNLDESGFVADPQIVLDSDDKYVTFNAYRKNEVVEIYNLYEFDDSERSYSESGDSYLEVSDSDMINTIKWNYPEELFPYKILKNTTEYDPFSYISYDYMISTSRTAKFDAFIDDYFDDETFDFINNLTRVGYKKKIDENNGKYDNDITLYNHFYYSTEDDEDEFVRIELDDNTKEHKIGKEIEDKYGKLRTVSSREIITEGVSTLMCRIYELTTDNERLVYSGLIDKRETKFDGTKLSVSLIDMMGLYVELSDKYNKVVSDFNDSGFDAISLVSSIREFILFIKNNININTKYLPSAGGISANNEYIGEIIKTYFHEYAYDDENNSLPLKYAFSALNDSLLYGYIKVEAVISDDGAISLSIPDINDINSNDDLNLNIENMGSESILMFNPSSANMLNITKSYNFDLNFSDKLFPTERKKYPVIFNLKYEYRKKVVDNIAKIRLIPNIAILYNNIVDDEVVNDIFTLTTSKNYEVEYDTDLDFFEYASDNGTSNMYLFIKDTLSDYIENISENIISFENEINSSFNNEAMFLTLSEESNYIFNNEAIASYISIFDDPNKNDYNYLIKVESQKRFIGDITIDDNYDMFKMEDVYFTNTYTSTIPLYADTYSLYDITKLFSLTCYNKILTKDTGELYFDKESYSENNGYIYIDKSDIINNFSQQSMIGDDEEFEILDNVYVGTKYIKEAYKRLETSTKENYKKLYENNNMKVSFNLRNHIYDIKSNLTTTIDQREIEPKDVIRIMHNGYEKIRVFVTSVKFINNNTEIEIEGITLQTRNITVYHLKSDSK